MSVIYGAEYAALLYSSTSPPVATIVLFNNELLEVAEVASREKPEVETVENSS